MGPLALQAARFDTYNVDASVPVAFAEAMVTTGTASGTTAVINLDDPLAQGSPFAARETDFAQLFVKNPHETGKRIFRELAAGNLTDLFIVLRIPAAPYPGVSASLPDRPQFAGSASREVLSLHRRRRDVHAVQRVQFQVRPGVRPASAVMGSGAVRKGGSRFLQEARPHL